MMPAAVVPLHSPANARMIDSMRAELLTSYFKGVAKPELFIIYMAIGCENDAGNLGSPVVPWCTIRIAQPKIERR